MTVSKYVSDRVVNAVIGVPCGIIETGCIVAQTTWGVIGTALSILSGGNKAFNNWAEYTRAARNILPKLYIPVVHVINPDASFANPKDKVIASKVHVINPKASLDNVGVITSTIAAPFFETAKRAADAEAPFERYIVSRLSYALAAVASVVGRVADLALGIVGATLAIIPPYFGRNKAVNYFAVRHLTVFGVVHDVCRSFRGIVNPRQFVVVKRSSI